MINLTSRSNPVCFHIRKLGRNRSYREEHKQFICDGIKLLIEAINSDIKIDVILTSEHLSLELPKGVRVFHVTQDILESVSPLTTSQKIIFSCAFKDESPSDYRKNTHILLDCIQDPGNVGTIIRCAHAFGVESVIFTGSTADIYSPKTIRATMGAIFKQKISFLKTPELFALKDAGVRFICASNGENAADINSADLSNSIIMMGNEGRGISKELFGLYDSTVKIPITNDCESINVASAAAIFMWEAMKGGKLCHH